MLQVADIESVFLVAGAGCVMLAPWSISASLRIAKTLCLFTQFQPQNRFALLLELLQARFPAGFAAPSASRGRWRHR
ncbi:protein of unknown function (plasmid) [Shinella sp. WSC3-e]|nr:hypothetical protein SHINE37_10140 [Rhizobiaceae bacterium]CAK7259491.1 protein of unknown function [Shinella sp. WSC3-e]